MCASARACVRVSARILNAVNNDWPPRNVSSSIKWGSEYRAVRVPAATASFLSNTLKQLKFAPSVHECVLNVLVCH